MAAPVFIFGALTQAVIGYYVERGLDEIHNKPSEPSYPYIIFQPQVAYGQVHSTDPSKNEYVDSSSIRLLRRGGGGQRYGLEFSQ